MIRYSLFFVFLCCAANANPCDKVPKNQQFEQLKRIFDILQKQKSTKAVPSKELAPAIQRLSIKYQVDPEVVAAIVMVESRGNPTAYNKASNDAGLMQINVHTAKKYRFDTSKLFNWNFNLEYGIIILSDMRGRPICTYNIGYRKLPKACAIYNKRIAFYKGGGTWAK